MNERKLYQLFENKIKKAEPNSFCYKIPDFPLGGKRPFDFFLLIQGISFAIEIKSKKGQLTKYQAYKLQEFILAGGEALVYYEGVKTLDEFIIDIIKRCN